MKKIIFINFFIILFIISLVFIFLNILNYTISGPPRYHEFVFNFEKGNIRKKIEKLTYYKSTLNKIEEDDFIRFESKDYKNLNFSGDIKIENCGKSESGFYELIYATDKNGFRENIDVLYDKTDFVLLGDSFTMSVCQNMPYDLKSQLKSFDDSFSYLNLGLAGDNFVKQLATLVKITENTKFDNLIWFFYEGNDYEDQFKKFEKYKKNLNPNHIQKKQTLNSMDLKDHYKITYDYKITNFYKTKVFFAELVSGFSSLLKYFKDYKVLLNKSEYDEALNIAHNYLENKNINNAYIYYIPSWQRLTNYKSIRSKFIIDHPQVKQLDELKSTVKQIAEKNGFKFVDGEQTFMQLKDPLKVFYYNLNTHFNRFGYRIMAEDLYNKILIYK